jgi:hypothetical protein
MEGTNPAMTLPGKHVRGSLDYGRTAHVAHVVGCRKRRGAVHDTAVVPDHKIARETAVAGRAADIDARLNVQAGVVTDLDRRIAQIDSAVDKATAKGRTGSAMQLADQQHKTRADLVAQRTAEAKTLAELQVQKAGIDGERKVVEADLGPVRYLATLLGAGDQDVLRWFILVVALLLDPAAALLLLAASSARR